MEKESDFFQKTYIEKLQDIRWIKARALIKIRDDHQCQQCGGHEDWGYRLEVHHIKYISGREPWEYPSNYLVTLCEKCHREVHGLPYLTKDQKYLERVSMRFHIHNSGVLSCQDQEI